MRVKELIAELEKYDKDLIVFIGDSSNENDFGLVTPSNYSIERVEYEDCLIISG
jgi:hypothetical protein